MNPNTNQPPYYNFQQNTPGPPQPQWQAPSRQRWGDPRVSSPVGPPPASPLGVPHVYGQPGQQLPPPPPPPPGGFQPAQQQNATPVSQHNTAAWGVKYNQGQQSPQVQDESLRPPLPPRPSSALSGQQTGWGGQTSQQTPPVPPPRPPEYAPAQQPAQNQYYPHEQYSYRPQSHHYEPPINQWSDVQQQPQQQQNKPYPPPWQQPAFQDAPVSPIEQQQQTWPSQHSAAVVQQYPPRPEQANTPTPVARPHSTSIPAPSASALGSGGPSDWQHYPGDNQVYEEQHYQPEPQHQQQQAPHGRQDSHSFTVTPEQVHALPTWHDSQPPQSSSQPQHGQSSSLDYAQYSQKQPTPERPHVSSSTSLSTSSIPARSGTIDSVMNAWNASTVAEPKVEPLKSVAKPATNNAVPIVEPRSMSSIQTQTDFPPLIKTETKIETKIETREIDPYEDLRNEYRTSLNRYATMLREEMAAQSGEDKMNVVVAFVNKEVKLWSVLFNAEAAELVRSSELADLRKRAEKAREDEKPDVSAVVPTTPQRAVQSQTPQLKAVTDSSQSNREDEFVVLNPDGEEAEYSPGGRPRIGQSTKATGQQRSKSPAMQIDSKATPFPNLSLNQPPSPASNAPMTLDDYAMPDRPPSAPLNRKTDVVPSQSPNLANAGPAKPPSAKSQAPIPFQPSRPAYTPFTYQEAAVPTLPVISSTNPADKAYTKLRHEQAAESGRLLKQETPSVLVTGPDRAQTTTPSRARQQQEEAFIGLLRQQSKAIRRPQTAPLTDAPFPLRAGTPLQKRQSLPPLVKSAEMLKQSLPRNLADVKTAKQSHPKLATIASATLGVVDNFGFIHATVVAWDKENRRIRQKLEAERTERESENQSHIDQLFHDNEIGYADIADLEEDFKIEEAGKKYHDDQAELESFSKAVFENVSARLEKELADLETLRVRALDVLDFGSHSTSARIRTAVSERKSDAEKAPLSDTMNVMLEIHQKIEIRQRKLAEAHFERERRRKSLELSVLYTNGDVAGVKKLEKDFDKAQAMQVLSEARKRDERANKLMDSFDRAAVKGLAENQEWIDEISNRTSLLRDLILGSEANGPQAPDREDLLYGPDGIKDKFDLLSELVAMVGQDSKDLVRMSSQADSMLNEADFAMFLAEAAIAGANEKDFEKLKTEKVKEDQKLKAEAEGRMNGTQRGPDEIFASIKDVKDFIGNDKNHQSRINDALERAKQRNQSPQGNEQTPVAGSVREV